MEFQFSSVQSLSHVQLFVTLWTAAHQASLSITISWSLPKLMCIESVMPSNHLIFCHPLLLPSIFPSIRRCWEMSQLFTSGSQSIGVSASTSVLPMNTQDWFPLGLKYLAGIPSPPLALFVVMLPKAHLTSHSRRSGSRWLNTPLWLSGSWRSLLYSSSVYSYHLFLVSSVSVRSIPFLSFIVSIFAWNIPLVSLIFLKRSPVFPILLFSSISLHWSFGKAFYWFIAGFLLTEESPKPWLVSNLSFHLLHCLS